MEDLESDTIRIWHFYQCTEKDHIFLLENIHNCHTPPPPPTSPTPPSPSSPSPSNSQIGAVCTGIYEKFVVVYNLCQLPSLLSNILLLSICLYVCYPPNFISCLSVISLTLSAACMSVISLALSAACLLSAWLYQLPVCYQPNFISCLSVISLTLSAACLLSA